MDNPTKAQMWLTSIEKIFRYIKCPGDQKVQYVVFFLEDPSRPARARAAFCFLAEPPSRFTCL
ncbi:histone H2B.3-like [Cucumis melo var. makuwa]|uniref:Histone H2B.3-like n=1 Tax=Cucumis melo var. makuwa TaxID=1194695 RepID=A0A5D3CIS6_CUCMM|nr:histone H2B.3-like [Cucumis melo var. makuwa]